MSLTPDLAKTILKFLLIASGAFLTLAFVAVLLPSPVMASAHQWLGLGEFPQGPIVEYLARSTSVLYGVHGVLMLYTGLTMSQHWKFAWLFGVLHIVIGTTVLITDIVAGMPLYWTCMEGGPIAGLGFAMLLLFRKGYGDSAMP